MLDRCDTDAVTALPPGQATAGRAAARKPFAQSGLKRAWKNRRYLGS